jgi:hypothetical protein
MKQPIKIKLTYFDPNKNLMITEEYSSLFECAKHYNMSVSSLKRIISGLHTKVKLFPCEIDYKFDLTEPDINSKTDFSKYHCDLCNIDIKAGSKSNHLLSIKHRQKIVGEK